MQSNARTTQSQNARFRVDNVVPPHDKPIEICLDGVKIAEILIEKGSNVGVG